MAPKAQTTKEKLKCLSSKLKTLCFKGHYKVKRPSHDGGNSCKSNLRVQHPESIKKSYNSTVKRQNNPVSKWAEGLNSYFSKQDTQAAKERTKRRSTSFITGQGHRHRCTAEAGGDGGPGLTRRERAWNAHTLHWGCKTVQPPWQSSSER